MGWLVGDIFNINFLHKVKSGKLNFRYILSEVERKNNNKIGNLSDFLSAIQLAASLQIEPIIIIIFNFLGKLGVKPRQPQLQVPRRPGQVSVSLLTGSRTPPVPGLSRVWE